MGSLALIGGLPRDGVPIKNWLLWHLVNIILNMNEMSDKKSLNNDVKEAGTEGGRRLERKVKVSCPVSVPWVSSAGPVIILLLLVVSDQKRITRWLYYVMLFASKGGTEYWL